MTKKSDKQFTVSDCSGIMSTPQNHLPPQLELTQNEPQPEKQNGCSLDSLRDYTYPEYDISVGFQLALEKIERLEKENKILKELAQSGMCNFQSPPCGDCVQCLKVKTILSELS